MTVLTGETLARLNADVSLPRYDRRHVTTGIVHIGVGNFHRSHQAMYIDTLMNSGAAMDWGICGIGLQPSNRTMRDVLAAQDGLYTLVLRHSDGTWEAGVIGSIVKYLFAPDDPEAAIEKMAAPATGSCRSPSPKAATTSTPSPVNSIRRTSRSWPTCAPEPPDRLSLRQPRGLR